MAASATAYDIWLITVRWNGLIAGLGILDIGGERQLGMKTVIRQLAELKCRVLLRAEDRGDAGVNRVVVRQAPALVDSGAGRTSSDQAPERKDEQLVIFDSIKSNR